MNTINKSSRDSIQNQVLDEAFEGVVKLVLHTSGLTEI
jgi:hypothetical protein